MRTGAPQQFRSHAYESNVTLPAKDKCPWDIDRLPSLLSFFAYIHGNGTAMFTLVMCRLLKNYPILYILRKQKINMQTKGDGGNYTDGNEMVMKCSVYSVYNVGMLSKNWFSFLSLNLRFAQCYLQLYCLICTINIVDYF